MKKLVTFITMFLMTSMPGTMVMADTKLPTDVPDTGATVTAYQYAVTETTSKGTSIYKEGRMISTDDLNKDIFIGINVLGFKLGFQYNKK